MNAINNARAVDAYTLYTYKTRAGAELEIIDTTQ